MTKDSKISISIGCTEFLVSEVEKLQRKNEVLGAQMNIVDNFFGMINRLGDSPRTGYGEDRLWQAKREIQEAVEKAEREAGVRSNPTGV